MKTLKENIVILEPGERLTVRTGSEQVSGFETDVSIESKTDPIPGPVFNSPYLELTFPRFSAIPIADGRLAYLRDTQSKVLTGKLLDCTCGFDGSGPVICNGCVASKVAKLLLQNQDDVGMFIMDKLELVK